jgi:branched-chain amino acid transport system substrate-binding protein
MAMSRKLRVAAVALAAAVAAASAGAARQATPGVTSDSILLGGTAPLTGEASAGAGVAKGAEAYF